MKKYAAIPINRRLVEISEGKYARVVRYILISYKRKKRNAKGTYVGTKPIDFDPYFNEEMSSQKYIFGDDYFMLVSDGHNNLHQSLFLNVKRPYEYDADRLIEHAYEFTAPTDFDAIEWFRATYDPDTKTHTFPEAKK